MKTLLPGNETSLLGTVIMPREFLEMTVKVRSTGGDHVERLWSGDFDLTASVLDPDTGSASSQTWQGAAGLVQCGTIPRFGSLVVQDVEITFQTLGDDVDRILKSYNPNQARVRMWRGFFNTATRRMTTAAEIIFLGFVDHISFPREPENSDGAVTLTCVSHTQEAIRSNPETRSDASQRKRSATDNFFQDVSTIEDQKYFWGVAAE